MLKELAPEAVVDRGCCNRALPMSSISMIVPVVAMWVCVSPVRSSGGVKLLGVVWAWLLYGILMVRWEPGEVVDVVCSGGAEEGGGGRLEGSVRSGS